MHAHRFFSETPLAVGSTVALGRAESHHIARVLRLGEGDEIMLFDGVGGEATARLTERRRDRVVLEVLAVREAPPPAPPTLHLLVPWLRRPSRLDWLIEKAAELGVERLTVFSAPPGAEPRRAERWRGLTIAAAKQSGQARLMTVGASEDPRAAAEAAVARRRLPTPFPGTFPILLSEKGGVPPLREVLPDTVPPHLTLAVGPEEGFTETQEREAESAGWRLAGLGPRRLRTETAAVAAVAVVRMIWD